MQIEKYSVGTGDRFAHQGEAQLKAVMKAKELGADVAIVWNKSNREHNLIGTEPIDLRREADAAVKALGYKGGYYVDADHIGLATVDRFLDASDFFTLDVADFTGKKADQGAIDAFVKKYSRYVGKLVVAGIDKPLDITKEKIQAIAEKYLLAAQEAGKIFKYVESKKGKGNFVTEVSMDETDLPQTPDEMAFILAAIADQGIPAQTIAPKFTGRFNKGVDYVGNVAQFEKEFDEDLCVIAWAIKEFGLPANLKLSVHSGSDKFSLYGGMKKALKKRDAGVHLKTAGTTWLEELIGLAEAGGEGLAIAKDVYKIALGRFEELRKPYATVIDIDEKKLPTVEQVTAMSGKAYAEALRHDQKCAAYNMHFRQLLHVSFKVAAEMGDRYRNALKANADVIAQNVTENLFERHLKQIFV
jgi:tagaturonate epimerase